MSEETVETNCISGAEDESRGHITDKEVQNRGCTCSTLCVGNIQKSF